MGTDGHGACGSARIGVKQEELGDGWKAPTRLIVSIEDHGSTR